jgi:hypothetical protein
MNLHTSKLHRCYNQHSANYCEIPSSLPSISTFALGERSTKKRGIRITKQYILWQARHTSSKFSSIPPGLKESYSYNNTISFVQFQSKTGKTRRNTILQRRGKEGVNERKYEMVYDVFEVFSSHSKIILFYRINWRFK